jgi:hypothetical protein
MNVVDFSGIYACVEVHLKMGFWTVLARDLKKINSFRIFFFNSQVLTSIKEENLEKYENAPSKSAPTTFW